jgi:lipooligosaccharide transport system ATP-binding protein
MVARGRPDELTVEHAGREVVEIYGPPARLREIREWADATGHAVRHTGLAIAFLRAESDDSLPEGERRPATLEDAYVALTGEEAT